MNILKKSQFNKENIRKDLEDIYEAQEKYLKLRNSFEKRFGQLPVKIICLISL